MDFLRERKELPVQRDRNETVAVGIVPRLQAVRIDLEAALDDIGEHGDGVAESVPVFRAENRTAAPGHLDQGADQDHAVGISRIPEQVVKGDGGTQGVSDNDNR